MRRKAYAQLLESYRSLSIDYMAEQFGVTREFIDAYMHSGMWLTIGISADLFRRRNSIVLLIVWMVHSYYLKLMTGIVETNRPDNKNTQYQQLVKEGDLLLNKLQKYQAVVRLTGGEA